MEGVHEGEGMLACTMGFIFLRVECVQRGRVGAAANVRMKPTEGTS